MKKIISFFLLCFCVVSCTLNTRTIGFNNKYLTVYRVYWATGQDIRYEIYTDSIVEACSFNGTNYLIERGQDEEILSTTAPIRIIKQIKYDGEGNECEVNI